MQTLIRRDKPPAELIVIDECHHATADSYQSILDAHPKAKVLGLSGTPFRTDGRGLGDLFGELVVAAYPDELCETGVLHRPKVWASKSPGLRGIKVLAGDYQLGALAKRTNTPGRDFTIHAAIDGIVKFTKKRIERFDGRKYERTVVNVVPSEAA